jgi:hypothetical protein
MNIRFVRLAHTDVVLVAWYPKFDLTVSVSFDSLKHINKVIVGRKMKAESRNAIYR